MEEKDKDIKNDVTPEQPAMEEKEVNLEERLKQLEEERDKYYDNWLRAEAELDNYKKRVHKEKEDFKKFAIENFAKDILTPIDYLEMAITHAKNTQNVEALIQGVEYTHKCLLDILKSYDIAPLNSEGEVFDPSIHEAHGVEERSDVKEGTVVREHRKGYKMCGRLLRAAVVTVAKAPEAKNEAVEQQVNNTEPKETKEE